MAAVAIHDWKCKPIWQPWPRVASRLIEPLRSPGDMMGVGKMRGGAGTVEGLESQQSTGKNGQLAAMAHDRP